MHMQDGRTVAGRAEMALVGGFAGLSIWALVEQIPEVVTQPHAYLAVFSFVSGFFAVLLGLSGPYRVGRSIWPALCLSAVAAVLFFAAGLRFDTLETFFDAGYPAIAWAILLAIGTPFAASLLRDHRMVWDYVHLFDVSWGILVRYSAAWLFAGVFWAVVFLSDALLQIVGLTVIDDLLDIDAVPYLITGAALGLGLSVVHEMRDYLSPFLVLRLLRLLIPVVLAVVVVFVIAALLQDPGALFGSLSRAGTLLAVAVAMISLVSVALDRGDADAVPSGWMRWATGALALLLPVIAALAGYALWLRVAQHGWTPPRLAAVCSAGIVAIYALTYAIAVITGRGWMRRIRQANIVIAGLVLALAALWLTPLLNAERISSASQVARILREDLSPAEAPLWELQNDWGRAGQRGLDFLIAQLGNDHPEYAKAIAALSKAPSKWELEQVTQDTRELRDAEALLNSLSVIPAEADIQAQNLLAWPGYRLRNWAELCEKRSDPGCVLLLGDFQPTQLGREGFLFLPTNGRNFTVFSVFERGADLFIGANVPTEGAMQVTRGHVEHIMEGRFEVAPSSRNSLWIGTLELFPEF
ncbi:DUF4153 domain-containing protein [Shimia sp. R11_0]|uniref:DUF4153 domain-containing protein n=1 Tax=Shimia sp. R11_0 TaxID=2821096 RepID=UPI001ADCEEF7|nr:DUF4153 domain-containing protein [Shimia sp. R11_0]MBO9479049.1 DUF4153 domain-containing protein [Shimia sp. R11_0]